MIFAMENERIENHLKSASSLPACCGPIYLLNFKAN